MRVKKLEGKNNHSQKLGWTSYEKSKKGSWEEEIGLRKVN